MELRKITSFKTLGIFLASYGQKKESEITKAVILEMYSTSP
jgi:hypothetical protein